MAAGDGSAGSDAADPGSPLSDLARTVAERRSRDESTAVWDRLEGAGGDRPADELWRDAGVEARADDPPDVDGWSWGSGDGEDGATAADAGESPPDGTDAPPTETAAVEEEPGDGTAVGDEGARTTERTGPDTSSETPPEPGSDETREGGAEDVDADEPADVPGDEPVVTPEEGGGGGLLPDVAPLRVLVVHGFFTAMILAASLAVYVSAVLGVIPPHFWVFSLPLLTLGLFGIVPVLAFVIGLWNPQELG